MMAWLSENSHGRTQITNGIHKINDDVIVEEDARVLILDKTNHFRRL